MTDSDIVALGWAQGPAFKKNFWVVLTWGPSPSMCQALCFQIQNLRITPQGRNDHCFVSEMRRLRLREVKQVAQGTQLINSKYGLTAQIILFPLPYTMPLCPLISYSRQQKCHFCVYMYKMLFVRDLDHLTQSMVLSIPWEFTRSGDSWSTSKVCRIWLCYPPTFVCTWIWKLEHNCVSTAVLSEMVAISHRWWFRLKLIKMK